MKIRMIADMPADCGGYYWMAGDVGRVIRHMSADEVEVDFTGVPGQSVRGNGKWFVDLRTTPHAVIAG